MEAFEGSCVVLLSLSLSVGCGRRYFDVGYNYGMLPVFVALFFL